MTADEIECTEEGGTEPTIALLRRLAAALDADVHLTAGHDSAPSGSNPTQLDPTSTAVRGHGAYRHTLPGAVGVTRSISAQSVRGRSSSGAL